MNNKKLLPTFNGPYKVVTHYRNDVTCRNLITDAIEPAFQASRLKMWHAYEEFVRARPALRPLLYTNVVADRHRTDLNRPAAYNRDWSRGISLWLGLPDPEHNTYVVQYRYTNWGGKKRNDRKRLVAVCDLFDERHIVNHDFVQRYGQCRQLLPYMTLVDKAMVLAYPLLVQEDRRERLLQQYRNDLGLVVEDI
eukprot:gene33329-43091_t